MDILSTICLCFVVTYLVNCEDSCEIKRVQNGDVLRKNLVIERNSAEHQTDIKASYSPANTSSSVSAGSSLYVRCDGRYTFQGGRSHKLAEITCTDGKWLPFPVCLLPPCDKRSLNYPGLDKGGERTYFHGESFEPICQNGYQVAEKIDKRIRCKYGKWTGNSSPCTQGIQCKLPEEPDFGSMELIGNSTAVGSVVLFMCEAGRQLVGSVLSTCNNAGEWTPPSPQCMPTHCEMVDRPLFGSVELIGKNVGVGSIVNFKCDPGRRLVGSNVSHCLNTGEWTFPTPECVEIQCEMPSKPEFGSFDIIGINTEVGSVVIYKCESDRRLVGLSVSKCLDTGEWTSPAPGCFGQCVIPAVDNGELGEYKGTGSRWWDRWPVNFEEMPVGTTLGENGQATLKCNEDYVSKEERQREITITCQRGNLRPVPECVTTSCLIRPPSIRNGRHRVRGTQHGSVVSYICLRGYKLREPGEVKCVYGSWVGTPPVCGSIHDRCTNKPPVPENGSIKSLRASSVEYECLPHYEMDGTGNVVCHRGQWTGSPPACKDSRCYLRNLNEKEGVDLTSDIPVESDSKANITCLKGYSLRYPEVYCENGEWKTENLLSPCEENKCYLKNLKEKEGVILTNDTPVESNSKANIVCVNGYSLRYPEVYCERGEWKTENLLSPCQKSDCEVKSVPNGEILKNRSAPVERWLLNEAGISTLHEPAVVGTFQSSGTTLYMKCNNQYAFRGESPERLIPITCRNGEWTPLPECQHVKGCTVVEKKRQSDILFSPDKDFYNLGESVLLWCPLGQDLTTDVQRSLCFTTGWTPDIPDCH